MFFTLFFAVYYVGERIVEILRTSVINIENSEKERHLQNINSEVVIKNCHQFTEPDEDEDNTIKFTPPASVQRYRAVQQVLRNSNMQIKKVVEFGCAGLKFARNLKNVWAVEEAVFVDLDRNVLEEHKHRIEPLSEDFINLRDTSLTMEIFEGSVTEYNAVLDKTDVVICIELIEHLYLPDVDGMTTNIFGNIQPNLVVITTPNQDFNVVFNMEPPQMRHWDHKFEWTRQEFKNWSDSVVERYPEYEVNCDTLVEGPDGTEIFGGCSQIAVFRRKTFMKKPVTVSHGVYKSVHEKQTFPYITDELVSENIMKYLNTLAGTMNDPEQNRKYFLDDKKLKKSTIRYHYIDFYELKSNIPFRISSIKLNDVLDNLGIQVIHGRSKEVVFPFVIGDVQFESDSESDEKQESSEQWDESCDENCAMGLWVTNSENYMIENKRKAAEMEGSDFINEESVTDEYDFDEVIFTDCEVINNDKGLFLKDDFPFMINFNVQKSFEVSSSGDIYNPFLTNSIRPILKRRRFDTGAFSFRDAIKNYNKKNNISFELAEQKQPSTSKVNRMKSKNAFKIQPNNSELFIQTVQQNEETKNKEKVILKSSERKRRISRTGLSESIQTSGNN